MGTEGCQKKATQGLPGAAPTRRIVKHKEHSISISFQSGTALSSPQHYFTESSTTSSRQVTLPSPFSYQFTETNNGEDACHRDCVWASQTRNPGLGLELESAWPHHLGSSLITNPLQLTISSPRVEHNSSTNHQLPEGRTQLLHLHRLSTQQTTGPKARAQ